MGRSKKIEKFVTIKRGELLARPSLLKPYSLFSNDIVENIAEGFPFCFLPHCYFRLTLFTVSVYNPMRTNKFLLHYIFHPLSIKVLGYLPISNYTMGFNLVVSTLKNDVFVATKQGLKNLSSRFSRVMRRKVEIQVQSNFDFLLFIHKNFNRPNYISLLYQPKETE